MRVVKAAKPRVSAISVRPRAGYARVLAKAMRIAPNVRTVGSIVEDLVPSRRVRTFPKDVRLPVGWIAIVRVVGQISELASMVVVGQRPINARIRVRAMAIVAVARMAGIHAIDSVRYSRAHRPVRRRAKSIAIAAFVKTAIHGACADNARSRARGVRRLVRQMAIAQTAQMAARIASLAQVAEVAYRRKHVRQRV